MRGKLLVSCLSNAIKTQVRLSHGHGEVYVPPNWWTKIGKREIVGPGMNNEPHYMDMWDFPYPSIRFREITPDLQVLKDKEKGDWKKLSIEEKKMLYRASFWRTFAEVEAPTGQWKSIIGLSFIGMSVAMCVFIFIKKLVYDPLPESFSEESRLAQLDRIKKLNINPIWGFNAKKST